MKLSTVLTLGVVAIGGFYLVSQLAKSGAATNTSNPTLGNGSANTSGTNLNLGNTANQLLGWLGDAFNNSGSTNSTSSNGGAIDPGTDNTFNLDNGGGDYLSGYGGDTGY